MRRDVVVEIDDMMGDIHLLGLFTRLGHRTGYVGVPEDLYNSIVKGRDLSLEIDVHGGITFEGPIPREGLPGYMYVGFDCAHYNDGKDLEAFKEYFPDRYSALEELVFTIGNMGTIRDINFVKEQIINTAEGLFLRENRGIRDYCRTSDNYGLYFKWLKNDSLDNLSDEEKLIVRLNNG